MLESWLPVRPRTHRLSTRRKSVAMRPAAYRPAHDRYSRPRLGARPFSNARRSSNTRIPKIHRHQMASYRAVWWTSIPGRMQPVGVGYTWAPEGVAHGGGEMRVPPL